MLEKSVAKQVDWFERPPGTQPLVTAVSVEAK